MKYLNKTKWDKNSIRADCLLLAPVFIIIGYFVTINPQIYNAQIYNKGCAIERKKKNNIEFHHPPKTKHIFYIRARIGFWWNEKNSTCVRKQRCWG